MRYVWFVACPENQVERLRADVSCFVEPIGITENLFAAGPIRTYRYYFVALRSATGPFPCLKECQCRRLKVAVPKNSVPSEFGSLSIRVIPEELYPKGFRPLLAEVRIGFKEICPFFDEKSWKNDFFIFFVPKFNGDSISIHHSVATTNCSARLERVGSSRNRGEPSGERLR